MVPSQGPPAATPTRPRGGRRQGRAVPTSQWFLPRTSGRSDIKRLTGVFEHLSVPICSVPGIYHLNRYVEVSLRLLLNQICVPATVPEEVEEQAGQ